MSREYWDAAIALAQSEIVILTSFILSLFSIALAGASVYSSRCSEKKTKNLLTEIKKQGENMEKTNKMLVDKINAERLKSAFGPVELEQEESP